MRNDIQIKITCLNINNKDEFHFDYYDKEYNIVGTVMVDETGKLEWSIWNNDYQANILDTVSYIFGEEVENSIEYIENAKTNEPIRWDRAQNFIDSKGLVVNYMQNRDFNNIFENGIGKKK